MPGTLTLLHVLSTHAPDRRPPFPPSLPSSPMQYAFTPPCVESSLLYTTPPLWFRVQILIDECRVVYPIDEPSCAPLSRRLTPHMCMCTSSHAHTLPQRPSHRYPDVSHALPIFPVTLPLSPSHARKFIYRVSGLLIVGQARGFRNSSNFPRRPATRGSYAKPPLCAFSCFPRPKRSCVFVAVLLAPHCSCLVSPMAATHH